jgi:anhydro-N-acetylmuramic acid kinase
MIIAGVMSGSSLDGLDVALVRFNGDEWRVVSTFCSEYTDKWVQRLKDYHLLSASEYIEFKFEYSRYIGEILTSIFDNTEEKIEYISFHGHTLVHKPADGYTEQIGNGGIIAGITGIPTIVDFRTQDVALGGVGTPLVPFLELTYLHGYDYYLNLGGIANITRSRNHEISAYDICPCNQVLNHFSQARGMKYDKDGMMASSGAYIEALDAYFSDHPYFESKPPKSLDNNWIREVFIPGIGKYKIEDILNTYCKWMANSIADQVDMSFDSRLYCTGGGTHNLYFISLLKTALKERKCELVVPSREMIDYKEAILMSALAKHYIDGKHNVLSSITGASKDSIGGAMYKVISDSE